MPTQDYVLSDKLGLSCVWTVKEKRNGLWVPVLQRKNVFTDYGLTAFASALSGQYAAPTALIIDTAGTTISSIVGTALTVPARVDLVGDTQLVLSPGLGSQETLSFTAVSGSGPYVYTLATNPINSHNVGDGVLRQPLHTDTLTSVISEGQYDSVNFPGQRMQSVAGYAPGGVGQWTIQFYYTGNQALFTFNTIGLSDSTVIGQGNLHNHFVLGYVHTSGNDVEIDGLLTLSNM